MSTILSAMSDQRQELVPHDIGKQILSYLDNQTLLRYERVCKEAFNETIPCWTRRFEEIRAVYVVKLQKCIQHCEKALKEQQSRTVRYDCLEQSLREIEALFKKNLKETADVSPARAKNISIFYEMVYHHLSDAFSNRELFASIFSFARNHAAPCNEKTVHFQSYNTPFPKSWKLRVSIDDDQLLKIDWMYDTWSWSVSFYRQCIVDFEGISDFQIFFRFNSFLHYLGEKYTWSYL